LKSVKLPGVSSNYFPVIDMPWEVRDVNGP